MVSLAAATGGWFFVGSRTSRVDRELDRFASSTRGARFTSARLTAPFEWGPAPSPDRGVAGSRLPADALIKALELQKRVAPIRSADALHVAAVAHLAVGEIERAVDALETAIELSPATAQLHSDLSVALVERSRVRGSTLDLVRALNEAETVLSAQSGDAVGRFNTALVLESLGATALAEAAWRGYLTLDARSGGWASEARQHLADLQRHAIEPASAGGVSPEIASLLTASSAWRPDRRACLAAALADIDAWRSGFDDGNRGAAAQRAHQAADGFRCAGVSPVASQVALGWAALSGRDAPAAEKLGRTASSRAAATSEWAALARADELLGAIALEQSRFADSEDLRRTALAAARRAGDALVVVRLERLLGDTAEEQGDHEAAWRHYQAALRALPGGASPFQRYDLLSSMTISAAHAGWAAAAAALAAPLVEAAGETQRPGPQILAFMERSRARAALHDADGAEADLAKAQALAASLTSPNSRLAWEAEVGWIQGLVRAETHPAEAIAGLSSAIDYFSGAERRFRLAELLLHRARLYSRLDQPALADADLQRGIEVLEDQRPAIRDEQLRISRAAEVWGLYAESIQLRRRDPRASLAMLERARARELLDQLSRTQESRSLDIASLQACLPRGSQALVYFVQADELLRWRVTATAITTDAQPIARHELERLVADAVEELRTNRPGSVVDALGRLLLPSSMEMDPDARLIFVPDAVLNRLPLAALPTRDGRRVVERAIPMVAPSLTTFCLASSRSASSRSDALLIGVGQGGAAVGLSPLPEVGREIDAIAAVYPRHDRLDGSNATASAVLDDMPRHTIIHFAGHAQADELMPSRSRLFLADATIQPSEIAALRFLPGTVIVLSACGTAVGREFTGEGALSLARPFLAAGATAVLGSLWAIDDEQARRFMEQVHRRLAAGEALESALARVQRSLITERAPSSAWSPYTVVGGASVLHSSAGGGS